jgi:hypothetical protein
VTYSGSVVNPVVTYRWEKRNGLEWNAIPGATQASYTPVAADANADIRVTVTGTGTNVTGSKTSNTVLISADGGGSGQTTINSVVIFGGAKVGTTVTGTVNYSESVTNPEVTYRWEKWDGLDWIVIPGATSVSYTPVAADLDRYIHVVVTGKDTNVTGSKPSNFVLIGAASDSSLVSVSWVVISGKPRVGTPLTANVNYSGKVTNPEVTYKWEKWTGITWIAIPGATAEVYTPVASDLNGYIQVSVTGTGVNVTGTKISNFVQITNQ